MTAIKDIRRNIASLNRLHTITKAMEAVSITKMKRAQDRAAANAAYFGSLLRIVTHYVSAFDAYLREKEEEHRDDGRHCLILVTCDRGLVGNLNAATLRTAQRFLDKHPDTMTLCIGKKGHDYARNRQLDVPFHVTNVSDQVVLGDVEQVADRITQAYASRDISSVHVVFQHFVSTFVQKPTTIQILPVNQERVLTTLKTTVFRPAARAAHEDDADIQYTVEPNFREVFDRLFDLLVKVSVYSALVENKASEHSARMIAMKNARDTSDDLLKERHRSLNKQRQAVITNEVIETLGGMQALDA